MIECSDMKNDVMSILKDTSLTTEQQAYNLSSVPLNYVQFFEASPRMRELEAAGVLSTMSEGNGTYYPRYILPDYEKLLREGSKFLRLEPAKTLKQALMNLLIMYRHVPSVTHYPVYLGSVDKLIEPYLTTENEEKAYHMIEDFLIFIDRMIPDSYCHMNLGPEDTKAGRMIIDIEKRLNNASPTITLLYDQNITPDDYANACLECALSCAKPSFANHKAYKKMYRVPYGIASCYNCLPVGGGSFTLSRIVLAKLAERAKDSDHLINDLLRISVDTLCQYIEQKVEFLVEQTQFFNANFLVKEGFIKLENFTAMVGLVGMNECVNILMKKEGKTGTYGHSKEADAMAHEIMNKLTEYLGMFTSKYCDITDHKFSLHAQVGIAEDYDISPGCRIAIGSEIPIHQHLAHCAQFHPYFQSGCGDIFPFDETARRNPDAILDLIKGSFNLGMRYFSTYCSDNDVIRITGYLVKKSDIEKLSKGEAVPQANATWGLGEVRNSHVLERMVRSL